MTKKKPSKIEQYKEADLELGRDELLKIIEADAINAGMVKNKIEAIKLLARMHKALQVDKVVATATAKQFQAQKVETISTEEEARIDKILGTSPTEALRQ